MSARIDVLWDMETGDPDDFLTLLLLAGHPRVALRAVTITPGTAAQVGRVRWALERLELDIPVGAFELDRPKRCVSSWHEKAYGPAPESRDARPGWEVLREALVDYPQATLLTGAPLRNLGELLRRAPDVRLARWVAQGGFAGQGVVPPERQLAKFAGLTTCPTYNFNGDPQAALTALASPAIAERRLVAKNVCHGVRYDAALHAKVAARVDASPSLALIHQGMQVYLEKNREGKKFHDPLAACCAIEPSLATWAEVELYRERGRWGAYRSPGSRTWIALKIDLERFHEVLLERSSD